MLTPISKTIEAFKKTFANIGTFHVPSILDNSLAPKFVEREQEVTEFLRTALEQRDEEWRELVESEKKEIPHGYYAQPVRTPSHNHTWNAALDDIITKSKGDMRTREEIETSWRGKKLEGKEADVANGFYKPSGTHMEGLLLETLLDIRDLLANPPVEINGVLTENNE